MSGIVALRDVVKHYGPARALDRASLELHAGRVHAIVGENGAGKSTLLKVVAGNVVADAGNVSVGGSPLSPATPREAIRRGVGMVHQHFMLVSTLTGLENLALGAEPTRGGLLDLRPLAAKVARVLASLGLELRLDVPTEVLSVGERQRLEIARVLVRGAKVVILDEPTALLAPSEARAVLTLARRLASEGTAVAIVTHHLDEVAEYADEVTVLRRGRVVAHHPPGDAAVHDARVLAREALGEAPFVTQRRTTKLDASSIALSLEGLAVPAGDEVGVALEPLTLHVSRGEIVGVAGVEGNGQRALESAIAGLVPAHGRIVLAGVDVTTEDVRGRRRRGLAVIPSDRHLHGIAESLSAADVLFLGSLSEVARGGRVDEPSLERAYAEAVRAFDVRPADPALAAGSLSGGNQQKVVVARELRGSPACVVAAQPTRGVDARAASTIRNALVAVAERGGAVLLVSSDLDELRSISDRIVVLRSGRLVAELTPEASNDAIGAAMLGAESHP